MTTSFFRVCCSSKRLTKVISHLHDTKLIPSLAFARSATLFRHQTISTETTAVKTLPSHATVSSDTFDIDVASLHYNVSTDLEIEKILSSVKDIILPVDVVYALKALRKQTFRNNGKIVEIERDHRFKILCNMFEHNCHSFPPSMLVSGIRSLLEIGLPCSDILVDNLELVVLSKISNFDMIDLIGCLHLHNKNLCTNRQTQVVVALIQEIAGRMSEINSKAEVFMLLQLLHLFDQQSLKQLETRIIQLFPDLETKDLIKIVCTLAESNKRDILLLNSAGFYLRQNPKKPNLKETVNVLYALNKLNYLNPKLLFYLTDSRETEIHASKHHSVIAGLLNACGQLKYRHSALLEACGLWILKHIDSCTSRELVSYLLTIAALNYIPKDSFTIHTIMHHLRFEDDFSKEVWLDVVWSLAVLNSLDKILLLNVLSPEFYTTLLESSNSRCISNKLKLLNLKCLLKLQYPEFLFSCDLFLDAPEVQIGEEAKANKELVITVLNNFVPQGKYMCTHRNSDTGTLIDGEFIMGKNGKPLLLSDYGLMSKPSTNTKDLPAEAKRMALMIWLYKDFTLNEQTLTGINALAVRLLSSLGYTIVQVSFEEFIKNKTTVKQVMYLSRTISSALSNEPSVLDSDK